MKKEEGKKGEAASWPVLCVDVLYISALLPDTCEGALLLPCPREERQTYISA